MTPRAELARFDQPLKFPYNQACFPVLLAPVFNLRAILFYFRLLYFVGEPSVKCSAFRFVPSSDCLHYNTCIFYLLEN